ncbi:glycosyltransferase [Mariniflexile soesokkakense]|uniref:Glycosyltransferase n=1 Tax=Mariniflexile soesokkakense TaxID=1343160 RepID=A0ABV0A7P3_9FLAO
MKLIFITHETSRTGAPMVLLHFLRWLKANKSDLNLTLLSLKKGELYEDFKQVVNEYFDLSELKEKKTALKRLSGKLIKVKDKQDALIEQLRLNSYDIIYSNTILSIAYGSKIKSKNSKHIAHIHELNVIIKEATPNFNKDIIEVDHFIAASELVKQNLILNWSINKTCITRVYECSTVNYNVLIQNNDSRVFHVGGSGVVHWRKGSDIFIQVARYIKTHYPNLSIQFTWVGDISHKEKLINDEDIRKMGIESLISFVGQQTNPQDYYNSFDLFLMTSREDPFPLVCIEVGMLGKPIICFENATGSEEIIKKGGGVIVPYLNIEAMAEKVVYYFNNQQVLKAHGEINKIEFSNFTPDIICPEYYKVIAYKRGIEYFE